MIISIPSIPDSIRTPGFYADFNTRAAAQGLPDNAQSILLIGLGTGPSISNPSFSGTGVNNMASAVEGNAFTGNVRRIFVVKISTAGTSAEAPSKFDWSADGGRTWGATAVTVTGSNQLLQEGVSIEFSAVFGQALGDAWTFYAEPGGIKPSLTPAAVYSVSDARTYFGAGSQLLLMVQAAFSANPYAAVTCIMQDPDPAAQTASMSGTLTAKGVAGVFTLWIGSAAVNVSVLASDTNDTLANKLAAAVNAVQDLPFRASATSEAFALTCLWGGASGNQVPVTWSATNNCASLGFSSTYPQNGGVDPDITAALSIAAPGSYTIYVPGYNDLDNLQDLRSRLETISGPVEQRPAMATAGFVGAMADAISLAGGLNEARITLAMQKASQSPGFQIAAAYGATIAATTDPAMPFDSVALTGVAPPSVSNRLLGTEIEALLHAGVTPLNSAEDGIVRIVRAISTYTLAPEGYEDPNLLDITTIRSLDYFRLVLKTAYLANFSRAKLTDDTLVTIQDIFYGEALKCEDSQILSNVTGNESLFIVSRATVAGRVNVKIPAQVVQGLHILAAEIDLVI